MRERPYFPPVASSFQCWNGDVWSKTPEAERFGRVLVLDSGIGGLSVARAVQELMPGARLLYLADTAAFPYGNWQGDELRDRIVGLVVEACRTWRPSAVVIACNTASTLVLKALRAVLDVPVVGTVPAIKPAAERTQSGVFAVLATPGTVKRDYTQDLISTFAPDHHIKLVGATRLAELAENKLAGRGVDKELLLTEISPCFVERDGKRTDHIVLGCTHYPFLKEDMEQVAPWPVTWIDPSPAIAKRLVCVLKGVTVASTGTDLYLHTD